MHWRKFFIIDLWPLLADQTPTPTRFLKTCEEVGLFSEQFITVPEGKVTFFHVGPSEFVNSILLWVWRGTLLGFSCVETISVHPR